MAGRRGLCVVFGVVEGEGWINSRGSKNSMRGRAEEIKRVWGIKGVKRR